MNEGTIAEGQILTGVMFNEPMRVVTTRRSGGRAVIAGMVGQNSGQFREVTLTQDDVANLNGIDPNPSYDGDTIHRGCHKGLGDQLDPQVGLGRLIQPVGNPTTSATKPMVSRAMTQPAAMNPVVPIKKFHDGEPPAQATSSPLIYCQRA